MNVANMLSYVARGGCGEESFELLTREASLRLPGVHAALWEVRSQMSAVLRERLLAPQHVRALLLRTPSVCRDSLIRAHAQLGVILEPLCEQMARAQALETQAAAGLLDEADQELLYEIDGELEGELWEEVLGLALEAGELGAARTLVIARPELLVEMKEGPHLDELLRAAWEAREEEWDEDWHVTNVLTRCSESAEEHLTEERRVLIREILATKAGRWAAAAGGLLTETLASVDPEACARVIAQVLGRASEYPSVVRELLEAEGERVSALVTAALPWAELGELGLRVRAEVSTAQVVDRALAYLAEHVQGEAATEVLWQVAGDFQGSVAALARLATAAVHEDAGSPAQPEGLEEVA